MDFESHVPGREKSQTLIPGMISLPRSWLSAAMDRMFHELFNSFDGRTLAPLAGRLMVYLAG
jgi:hypothetical protein